jgi:OOP family OmpA-OmpF porin
MRKIATTFLVLMGFLQAFAQNVQWASTVMEASSERSLDYQKDYALGKPGSIPEGKTEPAFWSPSGDNSVEFIKVGFETPLVVKQIIISQTMGAGAISEIYGYDANGREYALRKYAVKAWEDGKGLIAATMPSGTSFEVAAVKVVLDGTKVSGQKGIDAIGITNSAKISTTAKKLGPNVNTPDYHEINPILTPDGNRLYFSRRNHPDNVGGVTDRVDIWYSERQGDDWSPAQNVGEPLNNAGFNFIADVSVDGEEVILGNVYANKGKMKFGVSKGVKVDGGYGEPTKLDIINFHNYDAEFNFTLSKNKEIMIISADMDETEGKRDLYVSFLKDRNKNTWTYPLNMGNVLNTEGNEVSPYLSQDNVTLYFTSDGMDGYGNGDVYVSKRLDDTWTNWSAPENLGPFVNNGDENAYFILPEWSEYAFFAIGENGVNADIYTMKPEIVKDPAMVKIHGKLLSNCDPNKGVPGTVTLVANGKTYTATANDNGEYSVLVESGHNYNVTGKADGHKDKTEALNVEFSEIYKEVKKDICVEPDVVILSTTKILFDFDRSTLRPASRAELDRTYEYLMEAQVSYIIIAAHTDNIGTDEYNMGLSQRRATAVVDYLKAKGFPADKIRAEWYGESKPVDTNATRDGRQNNRRAEITIYR